MGLHAERDGQGPPIVLVHGFTQTRRCWGAVATDLAADHEVIRIDAPGHGRSAALAGDLQDGARLVGEAGATATYLGYSMGARLCLHVALATPSLVRGLVLIGGTAGIDDRQERATRRAQDGATADRVRREGVDAFVAGWLRQPLFASLPADAQFHAERLENTAEGLATSIELSGTGSQESLWDRLPELTMPVLLMVGELDLKFTAVAHRMATEIGAHAQVTVVAGAGHAAHLEQPRSVLALLRPWLEGHGL
ncbi:MAG: alpha/beta fold hydrolase [Acidimicrobiales bacterium]